MEEGTSIQDVVLQFFGPDSKLSIKTELEVVLRHLLEGLYGHFEVYYATKVKGAPQYQGLKFGVTDESRHGVYFTFQPGGNETREQFFLKFPDSIHDAVGFAEMIRKQSRPVRKKKTHQPKQVELAVTAVNKPSANRCSADEELYLLKQARELLDGYTAARQRETELEMELQHVQQCKKRFAEEFKALEELGLDMQDLL